MKKKANIGRSA